MTASFRTVQHGQGRAGREGKVSTPSLPGPGVPRAFRRSCDCPLLRDCPQYYAHRTTLQFLSFPASRQYPLPCVCFLKPNSEELSMTLFVLSWYRSLPILVTWSGRLSRPGLLGSCLSLAWQPLFTLMLIQNEVRQMWKSWLVTPALGSCRRSFGSWSQYIDRP